MSDLKRNCSVIGAGVIGLTTALLLRQQGWEVTVYEQAQAFSGSSWAGGGIISPVPPWHYPAAVQQLVTQSLQLYPHWLQSLYESSGVNPQYSSCGMLYLGPFDEAGENWRQQHTDQVQQGIADQWLAAAPSAPAWFFQHVAQLRNPRFGQALLRTCRQQGIAVLEHSPVARIQHHAAKVSGLILRDRTLCPCQHVVVAAGAWSDTILAASDLPRLGIKPIRGQMLLWKAPPGWLNIIVCQHDGYLIPRRDGHILGGSTLEDAGFDTQVTRRAAETITASSYDLLPDLQQWPLINQWSGLRPAITREVPVIGAIPGYEGLWVNSGHHRNGLGMAPASAQLLTALMSGQSTSIDAAPYQWLLPGDQTRPAA